MSDEANRDHLPRAGGVEGRTTNDLTFRRDNLDMVKNGTRVKCN